MTKTASAGDLDHIGKKAPKKSAKGRVTCSFHGGKAGGGGCFVSILS